MTRDFRTPGQSDDMLRRELEALRSPSSRMYHVVDLDAGSLDSEVVDGEVTPQLRASRLAGLGHGVDAWIFGGPSYQLTPRYPYHPSPLAWLSASNAISIVPETDEIVWAQAQDPGDNFGWMAFHFAVSPQRKSIASVSLAAFAWAGMTGHVTLQAAQSATSVSIPITHDSQVHHVDIVFVPQGGRESDVIMRIEAGVQVLSFHSVSFHEAPPVVEAVNA
jgi:hypothetical protein